MRWRSAAFLVTAVASIVACGDKRSEVLARAVTTDASPSVTVPATTAVESPGESTAPTTPSTLDARPSGPGVTDDAIKVGFVIVDQTQLAALLGFESPDSGDLDGQIEALAAAVNARGGIAGRRLEPVIRVFDALLDSPATEEALCRAFTEDDQVFAVVLVGQFQESARPCYAAKQTVMIDQTLFPVDQAGFEALAPYLWQPSTPEYGELLRGLADTLAATDFLALGTRLGVVGIDTEQNRRVFERDLSPRLSELGADPVSVRWIDPTSSTTLQAGQDQTVLDFKSSAVDRVIVIGGSRLLAFLLSIAVPQEYFPRYAMTSFDNPDFIVREVPETMIGAIGISIQPGFDVADNQLAFPDGTGEQRCLDMLAAAGFTFAARANARQSFLYCDSVFLLEDALAGRSGQPVHAEAFAEGVGALGDGWPSAATYAAAFEAGAYDGGAGYRAMVFDDACACFRLGDATETFR